jgi:antitoxin ParD1/3/4
MNVSLPPELRELVSEKVRSGSYKTPSEVIHAGLRLLRQRDRRHARLQADVRLGFDAISRGQYEEFDEESASSLAAGIKRRGRRRLARLNGKRS